VLKLGLKADSKLVQITEQCNDIHSGLLAGKTLSF
jgi:hypothetical protein